VHTKELIKDNIILYTDGGAKGNPGIGGYGAVLLYRKYKKELSGGFRLTTNNRMELLACIEGLKAIKNPLPTVVYSDSKYLVDAINENWLKTWKKRGWKRAKDKEVKNVDMWIKLDQLMDNKEIKFKWVKGHSGVWGNERCDELANIAMKNEKQLQIDKNYENKDNLFSAKILNLPKDES